MFSFSGPETLSLTREAESIYRRWRSSEITTEEANLLGEEIRIKLEKLHALYWADKRK